MLRQSFRTVRVNKVASALRTFSSVANDVDTVTTTAEAIQNFITEHQVVLKGASLDAHTPWITFDDTPFSPKLRSVLKTERFEKPSPIQAVSWPVAFAKRDIISVAKTGSGSFRAT
jgi:ATP-dependent RNA helicase DBP3